MHIFKACQFAKYNEEKDEFLRVQVHVSIVKEYF